MCNLVKTYSSSFNICGFLAPLAEGQQAIVMALCPLFVV